MSETRKPALQSNLNIKNIGRSITSLTKGIQSSQKTVVSIEEQQKKRGNFLRSLTRSDSSFFTKRQENIKRKNREDEIEASDITQGTLKQQGSAQSRSGRGFLGRLLDILGIVVVGFFTTKLVPLLPTLTLLVKLMGGVLNVGRIFTDTISEFVVSIEEGITGAFSKMKKVEIEDQANKASGELEDMGNRFTKMNLDFQAFIQRIKDGSGFLGLLINQNGDPLDVALAGLGQNDDMMKDLGLETDKNEGDQKEKEIKAKDENKKATRDFIPVASSMLNDGLDKRIDTDNKQKLVEPQEKLLEESLTKQFDQNLGDSKEKIEKADNKFVKFFKNVLGIDVKGNKVDTEEEKKEDIDVASATKNAQKIASAIKSGTEKLKNDADEFDLEPQGEGSGFVDISGMFDPVGTSNNKTEFGPGEFDNKIEVTSNPDDFSSLRLDENIAEEIKVDRKRDKIIIVQKQSQDITSGGGLNMSRGGGQTVIHNKKNDMKKIQSVILNA